MNVWRYKSSVWTDTVVSAGFSLEVTRVLLWGETRHWIFFGSITGYCLAGTTITLGIPQGSILGLVLFSLYCLAALWECYQSNSLIFEMLKLMLKSFRYMDMAIALRLSILYKHFDLSYRMHCSALIVKSFPQLL